MMRVTISLFDENGELENIYFYFIEGDGVRIKKETIQSLMHAINHTTDRIKMTVNSCSEYYNGELSDTNLKYFDIKSVFDDFHIQASKCSDMINRICLEMALNEEYCDFISDRIQLVSEKNPKLGYELSNMIFPKTIEILQNHMDMVNKNYNAYYNKANPNSLDSDNKNS